MFESTPIKDVGWLKPVETAKNPELGQISDEEEESSSESLFMGLTSFSTFILTIVAICMYLLTGPALIFLNRHILVTFDFPYPVFVSSLGLWTSALVSRICVCSGITKLTVEISWSDYFKGIVPSCFFMAMTLYTGNRSYFYLSVSLIQLIKALSPVMALMLAILFKPKENRTTNEWAAIIIICFGTAFGSLTATTHEFSFFGIFLALVAGFTECARLLYIQIFLQDLKLPTMEGLYYYAPPAVFWSTILCFILEFDGLRGENRYKLVTYPYHFIFAGFLGFAVNFAGFLVIKQTSAVALKVLGVVRGIGLVIVSVVFFNDIVSLQQFFGFVISTLGVFGYNYEKIRKKQKEMQRGAYSKVQQTSSDDDESLGMGRTVNLRIQND